MNIGFIGRVKDDDRPVVICIVDPLLQLVLCQGSSCRIVRQAEIDDIGHLVRKGRHETVLRRAGHVDDIRPDPGLLVVGPGPATHDIRIHIDGVDGIRHRNDRVLRKELLNVSGITLRPVGNEDLIGLDMAAPCDIVLVCHLLPEEGIAKVRGIAVETFDRSHLVNRLV